MRITSLNQIFGMLAVTATMCGAEAAIAQNAAAPFSMKTTGTPAAPTKPEIVPSLLVLNSRGAMLQGDTLILTGATPGSIFADRPVRFAGHQPTAEAFNVLILEGDITGADGGVALFIDIIGRPFTPMSFADVSRPGPFPGAMYADTAAYRAAAYHHSYARPVCGYYPFPPCY